MLAGKRNRKRQTRGDEERDPLLKNIEMGGKKLGNTSGGIQMDETSRGEERLRKMRGRKSRGGKFVGDRRWGHKNY